MRSVVENAPGGFEEALARIPLRRFGRPEDLAASACFLLSDAAAWTTGQTLHVNGGSLIVGEWAGITIGDLADNSQIGNSNAAINRCVYRLYDEIFGREAAAGDVAERHRRTDIATICRLIAPPNRIRVETRRVQAWNRVACAIDHTRHSVDP
jgi:Enoyl-(Acyl carrier protein) reductase